jgi:hypothetical protein
MLKPRPMSPSGIDMAKATVPMRVKGANIQKPLLISKRSWLVNAARKAMVIPTAR